MTARTGKSQLPTVSAFSYLRYSSAIQGQGDSIRRQTDLRKGWLARNPQVRFDDSVRFEDRGKSGFTGEHRSNPDRYALASFLRLVEEDEDRVRVPRGSYLIVENLDRLTREDIQPALILFLGLLQKGIRIVQLAPAEQTYDKDSPAMVILQAIMELSRGHEESKRKSGLIGAAWGEKKKLARSGVPYGRNCPAWIELVGEKYRIKPQAARAVRRIFELAAEGLGDQKIIQRLIAEAVPSIGSSGQWNRGYICHLMKSRAVLGEYQPMKGRGTRRTAEGETIPGYFPRLIPDDLWHRVVSVRESRVMPATGAADRRRKPRSRHPLAGLVVEARDGSPMYLAKHDHPGGPHFLSRDSFERRPGSVWSTFPVGVLTDALFSQLAEIRSDELFTDPGGSKIAEADGRLRDVERLLGIAVTKWEGDPENETWQAQVDKYNEARRRLRAELAEARREAQNPLTTNWAEAVELMRKKEPVRLWAALKRTVEEIRLLVVAHKRYKLAAVQVRFPGGSVRDYLVAWFYRPRTVKPADHVLWEAVALPKVGPGQLDLRNAEHVARLEAFLATHEVAIQKPRRPGGRG